MKTAITALESNLLLFAIYNMDSYYYPGTTHLGINPREVLHICIKRHVRMSKVALFIVYTGDNLIAHQY